MALTRYVNPATYSAAYSAIPLRAYSDTTETSDEFNYLVNILYSEEEINLGNVQTWVWKTYTYTRILGVPDTLGYKIGDNIFLSDDSGMYTGVYTIMDMTYYNPLNSNLIINLTQGPNFIGPGSVFKFIKYKIAKDLDDEVKVDLSNTIKDFVTENLQDNNDCIDGDKTVFKYKIMIGEEYDYVFEFEDNYFGTGGKVGFLNTTITDPNLVPFNIGDEIIVQQDLQRWYVQDNFFSGGNLGFTSASSHNFRVGSEITVTEQDIEPSYNGVKSVKSVTANTLVTFSPFTTATSPDPGFITGTPRPEYNTICRITDITVDGTGTYILTDNGFSDSTKPIPGTIKFVNKLVQDSDVYISEERRAYNARLKTIDYDKDGFMKYVIENGSKADTKYLSTILGTEERYRIEPETKSWLLCHTEEFLTEAFFPNFEMYDSQNNSLGTYYYNRFTISLNDNPVDYYMPVGLNQIEDNMVTITGSTFSLIKDDVAYYTAAAGTDLGLEKCNRVTFEVNDDCSRYEMYHLMWKDRLGSWLSYPFLYVSTDITEVERKNFYQTEEKWDLDSDTFGYDTFGRGEKTYFSRSRDKMILNSGWVKQFENELIKDLMVSASTYIQMPDGKLVGCQVENKDIQFGKDMVDQIYNYTFKVKVSRNEIRL